MTELGKDLGARSDRGVDQHILRPKPRRGAVRVTSSAVTPRIAIVAEQMLFAEALDISLTREGLCVTQVSPGVHRATSTLLNVVLRWRPTIALVDADLDDTGAGPRLVNPLSRAGVAVIAMTATPESARWGEFLRHGARTVLPMSSTVRDVVTNIRLVSTGRPVLHREERERLLAAFHQEKASVRELREGLDKLTSREQEVLCRLREGMSVAEIARWSCVSESTVRTQVRSILGKLHVTSQLGAVSATYRAGWHPSQVSTTS